MGVLAMERAAWIREIRRTNERQEDELSAVYDARWGEIEDTHRAQLARFLAELPAGGRVLDAACGTGKYLGLVIASGRSVTGVDHSGGHLAVARGKFPALQLDHADLQDLDYRHEFDAVMCVDALEMVPPEDWPEILARFARALRPPGGLYLTIELAREAELAANTARARAAGLPVVDREWTEPDGDYHYYPPLPEVRARLAAAGFSIARELEGPLHPDGHAYHHVVAWL